MSDVAIAVWGMAVLHFCEFSFSMWISYKRSKEENDHFRYFLRGIKEQLKIDVIDWISKSIKKAGVGSEPD